MGVSVVILAAGRGVRMHSSLPKVLHPLGGKPLLHHVLMAASQLAPEAIYTVVGRDASLIQAAVQDSPACHWVEQSEPLGTGHALKQALPVIQSDFILVLNGDVPLLEVQTLRALMETVSDHGLGLLYASLPCPTGFGRLIRAADGSITHIVEEKEATPAQKLITEVATGVYFGPRVAMTRWLAAIKPHTAAGGEYYLPDMVALAAAEGRVLGSLAPNPTEAFGINDKAQWAVAERVYQGRQAQRLMQAGVRVMDPARLDIRGDVVIAPDVTLDVGVILEGQVHIEAGCTVGPYTWIRNSYLSEGVQVASHSCIDGARLGAGAQVGPFARIRPGTTVGDKSKVGNFVELKNTQLGAGSKVNHLSYIGDAEIGHDVNVGAGTITCNYDGENKHKTVIEDQAFIGSNTAIVAPLTVGRAAVIGAGSVLTKDAPPAQLTLSRSSQKTVDGWRGVSKTVKE